MENMLIIIIGGSNYPVLVIHEQTEGFNAHSRRQGCRY